MPIATFTPMHMTLRGRQRLTDREGKILKWYRDSQGIWTMGVGHATTSKRPPFYQRGQTFTAQEVDDILTADLAARYEPLLNSVLTAATADHEFDALLSVTFNVEKFVHSTAVREHNAGRKAVYNKKGVLIGGCAFHILDWNKPKAIIGRRHTEQSQYLTPYTLGT